MAKLKDLAKRESWREMSESHRAKIKASQIINRLNGAALGEIEMTATQLRAGLGLLAKVLPDLSASDNVTTHIQTDPVAAMARIQEIMGKDKSAALLAEYTPQDQELH
jgi:hypothetical protein